MTYMGSRATPRILAWLPALCSLCSLFVPSLAMADPSRILVLPTSIGDHLDCDIQPPVTMAADPTEIGLARRVDRLVTDAVEDAGMVTELRINVSGAASERGGCVDDTELRTLAKQTPVIAPRIILRDGKMLLRIVAVTPNSPVLRLSTQKLSEKELDFRVVVMVSELLATETPKDASPKSVASPAATTAPMPKPRSQGKGVLALTSALLGGGWVTRYNAPVARMTLD